MGKSHKTLILVLILLVPGCAWSLRNKNVFEGGSLSIGMTKEQIEQIVGPGDLLLLDRFETGESVEIRQYKSWVWILGSFAIFEYRAAFVDDALVWYGRVNPSRSLKATRPFSNINRANNDLIFICGSQGMGVDFVTGNCTGTGGSQVNPYDLYPPFQSPFPTPPNPNDAIMRCQGKAVDFVTGRCMD